MNVLDAALRLLARRDYGRAELLARLTDFEGAEAALDRLAERGMQSDPRAIRAWLRAHSGRGRPRLRHELTERGFSPAEVDEALAELPPEEERAASVRGDRRGATAARFLAGRGFDLDPPDDEPF